MRHYKKLLLTAGFIVLAMAFLVTGAGAALLPFPWVQNDGSSMNVNGGWQIDDPGACISDGSATTRTECRAVTYPALVDAASCEGTPYCMDGSGTLLTQQACNDAGYAWVNEREWVSSSSTCRGLWANVNFYTWTGTCSDGVTTAMTACTAAGNDWQPNNTVYANGHQSMGSDRQGCLHCHSTGRMEPTAGANKQRYLLTGHKNMLRKAPGHPQGPSALGNVDWTSSYSDPALGFPVVGGASQYSAISTTYYVYGGWYRNKKTAQILRTTPAADNPSKIAGGGAYSCQDCHTTGSKITPGPVVDLSGGTVTPYGSAPDGTITTSAACDNPAFTNITDCTTNGANWVLGFDNTWFYEGVTCSRCHKGQPLYDDYFAEGTVAHATAAEFEEATELCYACHEQAVEPYQVQVSPSATNLTAYSNFTGHYRTNQYLASPHAKFSGTTHADVADPASYDSHFSTSVDYYACDNPAFGTITDCTSNGANWVVDHTISHNSGCGKCHDVHVSSVDPDVLDDMNTLSPIKADAMCGVSCHATKLDGIKHPSGPGTPMDNLSTDKGKMNACVTCHMGPGTVHLFNINAQASYSPFVSGSSIAAVDPTAGYPNAVSMSLDLACGQCHGGSQGSAAAKPGIMYFDLAALEGYAAGMHSASCAAPTASHSTAITDLTVTLVDTSADNNHMGASSLMVTVNWGDNSNNSLETKVGGSTFTHTYTSPGTYMVLYSVKAACGQQYAYANQSVTVAAAGDVTLKNDITVSVLDNAAAPIQGAKVYLKKQKNGGYIVVKTAYTDAAGLATFHVKADKNYKVVVYKSSVDFDGSKLGKQPKARTNGTTPGFALLQPLASNVTVAVTQGDSATNGITAYGGNAAWKGDDGTAPTVEVTVTP